MLSYSTNTTTNHNLLINNAVNNKRDFILLDRGNGIDKRIISNTDTMKDGNVEDIFTSLNQFLHTRTTETQLYLYRQLTLFSSLNDGYPTHAEFTTELKNIIENIFSHKGLQITDLEEWVVTNLQVPSVIEEVYDGSKEGVYSRDKTYLKNEYIGLTTLALAIKLIAPIFIVYTSRVKEDYKNREFLLAEKLLPYSIRNYHGYTKLSEFTAVTTRDKLKMDVSADTLFNGAINEDNRLDYVFTAILIPKLLASLLLSVTDTNHLLTFIYKFIGSKADSTSKQKKMKDKILTSENIFDENDSSGVLDAFRPRNTVPISNYVYFAFTAKARYILPRLNPDLKFNMAMYKRINKLISRSDILVTETHHELIWMVLYKHISYDALKIISSGDLKDLISITYTLLVKDHPMLATLLLSSPVVADENEILGSPVTTMIRLNKAITLEINERYINRSDIPTKRKNPIIDIVINEFVTGVVSDLWEFTFDTDSLPNKDFIEGSSVNNATVQIPSDLNAIYYDLIKSRSKYL